MKRIEISDEVWKEIEKRGRFKENEDDVLRRVFGLPNKHSTPKPTPLKNDRAKIRMSTSLEYGVFWVKFQNGQKSHWQLPAKDEKAAIRRVRDLAVDFARQNGASIGQVNAVKKALTDEGYYLAK